MSDWYRAGFWKGFWVGMVVMLVLMIAGAITAWFYLILEYSSPNR